MSDDVWWAAILYRRQLILYGRQLLGDPCSTPPQPLPPASGVPRGRLLGIYATLIEAWRPSPTAATLRAFRDAITPIQPSVSDCYLKFAGLAAFIPVKLPLSTILLRSFPFSRSFRSSRSLISHSYLITKKGNQDVCSTHELTRYSHTHIDIMPPKQATLGYVKPKQQTLGCMLPALRL